MSGWLVSVAVMTGILGVFASTGRIAPISHGAVHESRAAARHHRQRALLGEFITPLQAFGGAVMIAALVAFQLRR